MSTKADKDVLYLGSKHDWEDTSNAAIYIDLEDAAAQGIKINEYVSAQTAPSIEVENNAGTTVFQVLASATTANAFQHTVDVTTGNGMILTANSLTTGSGLSVNSSATAITTTGRLLEVFHTGATSTSGTIIEFKTSAADETNLLEVDAAALTTGTIVGVVGTALTTGFGLQLDSYDALTTGVVVDVESGATAITGAGRLLRVDHSGATSTSGILSEFASAATDETTVLRVTASGALAAGVVLDLSAAAVTTGTVLDIGGLDALTTGTGVQIESDSADTGAWTALNIVVDNAAATSSKPVAIQNDANTYCITISGATTKGIDLSSLAAGEPNLKCTQGTAAITNTDVANADGFINIDVGGTNQSIPYYTMT